jgi:uncharacterized membrane protein
MNLTSFGIIVVFIGIILVIVGALTQASKTKAETKVAVGGFIGPIPFGFANDKMLLWAVFGTAVLLVIIQVIFFLLTKRGV